MNIIWKDVEGYEGKYQVSNEGKVKSLERSFIKSNNRRAFFPERILVPFFRGKYRNYHSVKLCDNGVEKTISIHRLVALAFVEGWFKKAMVNHKDGNTINNHFTNIEWVNNSQNQLHAYKNGLNKTSTKQLELLRLRSSGANNKKSKLVIDLATGIFYDTIREAAFAKNINENKLFVWVTGINKNKSSIQLA